MFPFLVTPVTFAERGDIGMARITDLARDIIFNILEFLFIAHRFDNVDDAIDSVFAGELRDTINYLDLIHDRRLARIVLNKSCAPVFNLLRTCAYFNQWINDEDLIERLDRYAQVDDGKLERRLDYCGAKLYMRQRNLSFDSICEGIGQEGEFGSGPYVVWGCLPHSDQLLLKAHMGEHYPLTFNNKSNKELRSGEFGNLHMPLADSIRREFFRCGTEQRFRDTFSRSNVGGISRGSIFDFHDYNEGCLRGAVWRIKSCYEEMLQKVRSIVREQHAFLGRPEHYGKPDDSSSDSGSDSDELDPDAPPDPEIIRASLSAFLVYAPPEKATRHANMFYEVREERFEKDEHASVHASCEEHHYPSLGRHRDDAQVPVNGICVYFRAIKPSGFGALDNEYVSYVILFMEKTHSSLHDPTGKGQMGVQPACFTMPQKVAEEISHFMQRKAEYFAMQEVDDFKRALNAKKGHKDREKRRRGD